ncbi:MAG: response regulator transcription factor [Draconibacterium sp.]|nr:response regulator transcription factor [Draconibacterium sp.]
MKKILIIEDEDLIRMALEDDFSLEGYEVDSAADGKTGMEKALNRDIDLIILDVMLPEMNGFDICKNLRMQGITTPIIMLTAKGQEIDRVVGLEMGADDYVTKPFSPRELHARVKAVLRRTDNNTNKSPSEYFQFGKLEVDFLQYECRKNEKKISLTTHEFDLLKYLVKNRGRVINRDELLDEVWGKDVVVSPRTIDTHMANLRKKIEEDPNNPKLIISVRGVGYKIGS